MLCKTEILELIPLKIGKRQWNIITTPENGIVRFNLTLDAPKAAPGMMKLKIE